MAVSRAVCLYCSLTCLSAPHVPRCCSSYPPPRERVWKLKQCKRFAQHITRSGLGIEARAVIREREAAEAIRRKAQWIGKQVRDCARCRVQDSGGGGGGTKPGCRV